MNVASGEKPILVLLLAVFAAGVVGCGSEEDERMRQMKGVPLEKKLADLDAGHIVGDYNDAIPHFKFLLEELGRKFVEDPEKISAMTLATQKMLKQKGVYESLADIMDAINATTPRRQELQKYQEYAKMYVRVRGQKMSREEAIGALKLLMSSKGN